ncbi:hypothetical protein AAVH_11211 [Aphelenchoides avenae]|nr:hypothetical protein AAVH_11211 [Aphelenchus avenae]
MNVTSNEQYSSISRRRLYLWKKLSHSWNETARKILGKEVKDKLDSQGWSGREELHKKIVKDTVDALSKNTSSYVFNALAFLPDDRTDRQCREFAEDRVVNVGYQNLNFFVLYANSSSNETAEEAWEKLKDREDARDLVLDHVFDHEVDLDDFRGRVAAVRCGYEFVWYELGYTYFYAAHRSTDYKWEKKGSAYDAMCGQIFFFP